MRIFLVTNILFSGMYSDRGAPARLLDLFAGPAFQAVTSNGVLEELARNVARKAPRLMQTIEQTLVSIRLEIVPESDAAVVVPLRDATFGTDAPIIAAAMAANVDYFCTGDRRLLERGRSGALAGLRVAAPSELVRVLDQAGETPPSGQA